MANSNGLMPRWVCQPLHQKGPCNARFGSKGDLPRPTGKGQVSGLKRPSNVCFFGPEAHVAVGSITKRQNSVVVAAVINPNKSLNRERFAVLRHEPRAAGDRAPRGEAVQEQAGAPLVDLRIAELRCARERERAEVQRALVHCRRVAVVSVPACEEDFVPSPSAHPPRADAPTDPSYGRLLARLRHFSALFGVFNNAVLDGGRFAVLATHEFNSSRYEMSSLAHVKDVGSCCLSSKSGSRRSTDNELSQTLC